MLATGEVATVGQRIRDARTTNDMTQSDVAKHLGVTRVTVSQWESDTTSPSIYKTGEIASLLNTRPEWLAFGVDGQPKVVREAPAGLTKLREITFGETPGDQTEVSVSYQPSDYLKSLNCSSLDGLIVFRVEGSNMAPLYDYNDRVIVDTNAKRPTPSGVFLIWDGYGPALNEVSVVPSQGQGPAVARVSSLHSKETYEVPVDKLVIIGRVRALIKNV